MAPFDSIPVTALGVLAALACVVGGVPLFGLGRRALRLRRVMGRLEERPLSAAISGWVQVSGRVVLESPLFAPLSGRPCAGFDLEVCGENTRVGGVVGEHRAFRLEHGGASAFVSPDRARWQTSVTDARTFGPDAALPERLAQLLETNVEIRWLRARRAPLRIVERALEPGAVVSVLGVAREEHAVAHEEVVELAATGTDDGVATTITAGDSSTAELWIVGEDDEPVGARVFSEPPDPRKLQPSLWHMTLVGFGPALSLIGLLYLARAVAPLIGGRL